MITESATTLRDSLANFFSDGCKVLPPDVHTGSVPIEIPLAGYDDENVIIFVEENDEGTLLHDGGRFANYLLNHGILAQSKQKRYADYARFYHDLAQRHCFAFSEKHRRFELLLANQPGRRALEFVECLIALSFLAMTKSAGLKPHSLEEVQRLSGLKLRLSAVFPEMKISAGMVAHVHEKAASQDWGLTVNAPSRQARGCIHYLRGPDWAHVFRSTILLNSFWRNEAWFGLGPGCLWGVYGGPPEHFDDVKQLLSDLGKDRSAPIIRFGDEEELFTQVSDRLSTPLPQHWKHLLRMRRELADEADLNASSEDSIALEARSSPVLRDQDLWHTTGSRSPRQMAKLLSTDFETAGDEVLDDDAFTAPMLEASLKNHGLPFARYLLERIKSSPEKVHQRRFECIADGLLRHFQDDPDATTSIDSGIAEIEGLISSLPTRENVFRDEETAVSGVVIAELKALKRELMKVTQAQDRRSHSEVG